MIDKFKPLYRVKDVAYALKISEQYVYQVLKKAGRSPVKNGVTGSKLDILQVLTVASSTPSEAYRINETAVKSINDLLNTVSEGEQITIKNLGGLNNGTN